jgi:pimeloyl-ACP methyl ester carboxylesterase
LSPDAASSGIVAVEVRGGAIEVEVAGAGPPLMLLHGWALDRRIWRPQIQSLSARFRTVAIDRRGFGRSSAPPDLAAEADDLRRVAERLGLGPMVLVGMSQAGRVVLRFALAYADSVAGIVLQGAPLDGFLPAPREEDAIPLAGYRALARAGEIGRMKRLWRGHRLMRTASPAARACLDRLLADYQGRDLLADSPGPPAPTAGRLGEIAAPALVVTGEHDTKWRRLVGDALAYGLPHAERAVIDGADHLCNLSHPERFNALVGDFAARVEASAR